MSQTPEERAVEVARKLFGHRWDDLEEQQDVYDRFMPIAAAIRAAVAEEREKCATRGKAWIIREFAELDALGGSIEQDGEELAAAIRTEETAS